MTSTTQAPGSEPQSLEGPPGLLRMDREESVSRYLKGVWRRRELASAIAVGELRSQNMNNVLGSFWHLLNPLLLIAVYFLIFGVVLDTSRGVDNFVAFLAIGVFCFNYSQKSVMAGTKAIVANEGLIRSIRFPRALLPLSSVLAQALSFVPTIAVMLAVALLTGERPRPEWLLLVPFLLLQTVFNLGASFVVARATDRLRDVREFLPYVFRLCFYLSGVLYAVDAFVEDPLYRLLFDLNPFYAFITLARAALLPEVPLRIEVLLAALTWSTVLIVGGFFYFRRAEREYGRG